MPVEMRKVKDYVWEIPATGGMRVPGRIYADEKLMRILKDDEAPQQVANVAHLPGIVGYSLAMPDIHWGYGFPIGGVAAFDPEEGVVSPGGVGYDINCLAGASLVLHPDGYTRPIREVVEKRSPTSVALFDRPSKRMSRAEAVAGFGQAPRRPVWELVTDGGRRLVATEDHPVLTPEGMRKLGGLRAGDRLAVVPFEGVPYEAPTSEVLVTEQDLRRTAARLGRTDRGLGLTQAVAHLRPLLPLTLDHPALPALLKTAGYLLGDGSLGLDQISINGRPQDLRRLAADLNPWVTVSRVYSRDRRHCIRTTSGEKRFLAREHAVHIRSTGFSLLLAALGIPVGLKASQAWGMPSFLWRAPLWQQRLFLAAFFGAELTAPDAFRRRNHNFKCPVLTVVKRTGHVESGERFLREVARMLDGFGVRSLTVSRRDEQDNPDGTRSVRLRLILSDASESLINLWARVGYEYNAERARKAAWAVGYLCLKRTHVEARALVRGRICELRAAAGWGAKKLLAAVNAEGTPVNLRFVERTIYGGADRGPRVAEDFPTFETWKRRSVRAGAVWERVLAKTPRRDIRRVYDLTVDHPQHSFVANGFVVHNCGVRLMRTGLDLDQVAPVMRELVRTLFRAIPTGVGSEGGIPKLSRPETVAVATEGARWAIGRGYGRPEDVDFIEENGRLGGADPDRVSDTAFQRGAPQVGTLGSGNHFLEVDVTEEIFAPELAERFGLRKDGIVVIVHSGSRGFGYQVCDDYLKKLQKVPREAGIELPDRQLVCAPIRSHEAQQYLRAMACAANFAWANRQVLMSLAERALCAALSIPASRLDARLVYDVCHNIAKFEEHAVEGKPRQLLVHRKGATRALPAGHPLVPAAYRDVGQPVLIPGDMGRASYLLVGLPGSLAETFGSTCHGAGRVASRSKMLKATQGRNLQKELEDRGVFVLSKTRNSMAEEMPEAYKDVADVVGVMEMAGVSRRVARFRPLGVIKG
ncbi:MAG: RtcB family protein [Planctomycetes bacterium]|nr:RtcB family protein [Planctomycetota bacterium]